MSLKDRINSLFPDPREERDADANGQRDVEGDPDYEIDSSGDPSATLESEAAFDEAESVGTGRSFLSRFRRKEKASLNEGTDDLEPHQEGAPKPAGKENPAIAANSAPNALRRFIDAMREKTQGDSRRQTSIEQEILDAVGPCPRPLFLLGELSPRAQYVIGGTLVAALLASGVIVGFIGTQAANFDLERVSIATRVQMLSQRLVGAAQLSLQGDLSAVNKMRTAEAELEAAMSLLTIGNEETGMRGLSREQFDSLLSLERGTRTLNQKIRDLINLSTSLVQIDSNNAKLEHASALMFEEANRLHSVVYSSSGATSQQLAAVDHLRLLSERIHRHGIILLRSPVVTGETLSQLVADAKDYREILDQLKHGDDTIALKPLSGAKAPLESLDQSLADVDSFVAFITKHSGNILAARQGQKALAGLSDAILRDATRLTEQLSDATNTDRKVQIASVLLLFGAMLSMLVLALINIRLARIDAWYEAVRNRQAQMEATQAEERNMRNETDMIELMTDISALELGDLTLDYTKNLQAMEGIAGSVRSSVNEGVIALRNAVDMVKGTAGKVSELVAASVGSTRALEQSNEKQSSEIDEVVTEVTNLADNIGLVTERTLSAARIAEEGKAAAAEGSTVVERGERAMAQIRTLMQDVLKSVKHSGETSQEILEINDAIESITDRMSIIALNAEMEAARAGPAGAPIKVLAAEVARLAETSMQFQASIGALAQRNQGETAATIKLVEDSANAVVEGARLSSLANAELLKIADLTSRIAEIMSEIEVTAKSQATNAHTVTEKMAALSNLSRQFQVSVNNVVESVDQIDKSMGTLKRTVDQFRTDPDAE